MRLFLAIAAASLALFAVACSSPTKSAYTVDSRPTISFQTEHDDAEIYLDGRLVGTVKDYAAYDTVLKVQPGTHVLRLELNGQVIADEKFFVSNGANKIINVP